MKQKQLLSLAVILGLAATLFVATPGAQAASDWATYFSNDEAKAIKSMVDKSIRNSLEDPEDDWEEVIDKNAVSSKITKRKVYTGTYVANASATAVTSGANTLYYQDIEASVVDLDRMPSVNVYERAATLDTAFGATTWVEEDSFYVTEEHVWVKVGENATSSTGVEYKVVVNY